MPFDFQIAFSSLLGASGVACAALGAHLLRRKLTPERSEAFRTGAQYSILGAISGIALRALKETMKGSQREKALDLAICLISCGAACFSWSIYWLCLGGPRILGPVTPFGGLLMIAGWASAGAAAL